MRSRVPLALLLAFPLVTGSTAADVHPPRVHTALPSVPVPSGGTASASLQDDELQQSFDQILDLYVRDGFVYYKALKSDRAKLDHYLASLALAPGYDTWPRERQLAFWLNAYNGFVLQSVINNYPIRGHAAAYPSDSIRQIPGVFDRTTHRAAGRALTLDAIENAVLSAFKDPRVYFALGRGAAGGGRLRSEAYLAGKLGEQLKAVAAEVVTRPALFSIDQPAGQIRLSPIFGWHEADFAAVYAAGADPRFASRSPLERAVVAFALPKLLPDEAEFVNKNTFQASYGTFDWRLNDLATRR
jgi:hypothetical protein